LKLRLNRYISIHAGISRRTADDYIKEGRIIINGQNINNLATFVEDADSVSIDGKKIASKEKPLVYIMMNKPKGYLTSRKSEKGFKTVIELIKKTDLPQYIYPVGRLDLMSEGLLLLTNDGDFAFRVTHPKFEVIKSYIIEVKGTITSEIFNKIKKGVYLKDSGLLKPHAIKIVKKNFNKHLLLIELSSGKNREIRKLLEFFHLEIVFLRRVKIGGLSLGELPPGEYKFLKKSAAELAFKEKQKEIKPSNIIRSKRKHISS
jgi:23S rRNA pseudouridine2605 synthase